MPIGLALPAAPGSKIPPAPMTGLLSAHAVFSHVPVEAREPVDAGSNHGHGHSVFESMIACAAQM